MLDRMRTVPEFRKRLGPFAEKFTNADLEQLQREMEAIAQLLIDLCLSDREKGRRLDARLATS